MSHSNDSGSIYQPLIEINDNVGSPEMDDNHEQKHQAQTGEQPPERASVPVSVSAAVAVPIIPQLQPQVVQAAPHPFPGMNMMMAQPYAFPFPMAAGAASSPQQFPPGTMFYAIPSQTQQQGQAGNGLSTTPVPVMAQWPQVASGQPQSIPQGSQQAFAQPVRPAVLIPPASSLPAQGSSSPSTVSTSAAPLTAAPQFIAVPPPSASLAGPSGVPVVGDGRPLLMHPDSMVPPTASGGINSIGSWSNEKKQKWWRIAIVFSCVNFLVTLCAIISPGVMSCGSGLTIGYFYSCMDYNRYGHHYQGCNALSSPDSVGSARAFILLAFLSVIPLVGVLWLSSRPKYAVHAIQLLWASFVLALWNWICNMIALPSLSTATGCRAPHVLGVFQILIILGDVALCMGLFAFAWKKVWFVNRY